MASHTNPNDEDLSPALRLSQLSSDEVDEQIPQPPTEGSTSANHMYRPHTPTGDEGGGLAPASRLSLLPSDDFDEQVAPTGSASASEEARSSIPPNKSDQDDLELALILSLLLVAVFHEQVRNQRRESRTKGSLGSSPTVVSLVEVRTASSSYINKH
jgi:hypothetical protein